MTRPDGNEGLGRAVAVVAGIYLAALGAAVAVGIALGEWHPLAVVAAADLVGTIVVFAGSVRVNNTSMYDPYWSVAPIAIAAYFAFGPAARVASDPDPVRVVVVCALVALWGARLTWSWLRGWRGLGHEDWRYVGVREKTGRLYWPASFLALHLMPTVMVYLGCLSLYVALSAGSRPFGVLDGVAAVVTATAIWIEARADKELHRFVASGRSRGAVLSSGLWAYSRHPNYFGEILFWWGLLLFALAASPSHLWVVIGPVAITTLFAFVSIPLIEKRMLHRRGPAHAERVKRVSALIPWPPKR